MSGFSYVKTPDGFETLTILMQGELKTVTSAHRNFNIIFDKVRSGDEDVEHLIDATAGINEAVAESNLSNSISVERGRVFFEGKQVHNACAEYIVELFESGSKDFVAFANFMVKVLDNDIHHTRNRLFDWLQATNGFSLTPDGDIVGYKGLRNDLRSIRSGPGQVNGVQTSGNLDNAPGNTLEIDEAEMDPSIGCSYGLHVGTWEYASGFGSRYVSVVVDPRSVVSVPTDCSDQKMRVLKYKVKEELHAPYSAKVVK